MNCDNEPQLFQLSKYTSTSDLIAILENKTANFNILSINIQCLNAKFNLLQALLLELQNANIMLNCICIQETWIKHNDTETMFNIPGYTLISSPCEISQHGGLAIYLQNEFNYNISPPIVSESKTWENQRIEILIKGCKNISITNLYRPPNIDSLNSAQSRTKFSDEFLPFLELSTNPKCHTIFTGDFNIDLLKTSTDSCICNFCDSIITSGFLPTITLPTRYDARFDSASLIDNILLRTVEQTDFSTYILTSKISDHYGCILSAEFHLSSTHSKKNSPRYIEVSDFSDKNVKKFTNILSSLEIQNKLSLDLSTDFNYNTLEKNLVNARKQAFPIKRVKFDRRKHKINEWITEGILRSINFKNELHYKYVNSPLNSTTRIDYKFNLDKYDKYLKSLIRTAKQTYFHKLFTSYGSDMKKTWSTINNVLGRKQKTNKFPDSFLIKDTSISDPKVIADEFNNFFINIGENLASTVGNASNSNISFKSFLKNKPSSSFSFQEVDENQVLKVIDSLKSKTSSGYDLISTKLLKQIKTVIAQPLTFIFNQSLNSGFFPDHMKIAKVSPLYKKGNSSLLDNYRPISLLPSCSKVFEKILHTQLMDYFITNNLFFGNQYGFRPKHSTELATLELTDRLLHFMDKKSPDTPFCIYMDLSKAFDVLDHSILMDKLNFYGLDQLAISLLSNYLTNRKQFVVYDNIHSDQQIIRTGVPQGSILGPLLFLIFINDISESSSLFNFICYADDTTLISTFEKFKNANVSLNTEIGKVSDWLTVNKLILNVNKTKYMIFSRSNKIIQPIDLEIHNQSIEQVRNFNFLGLTIDEKISWRPHIDKISCKISKAIGILSKLKRQLPLKTLTTIYNSLILPHINYCLLTWCFSPNTRINIQLKKAVRIICNVNYNSHTTPLFKQLRFLSLSDIILRAIFKFIYQIHHNSLPVFFTTFKLKSNASVHSIKTRRCNLPHLFANRFTKEYTRACIRYCHFKLLYAVEELKNGLLGPHDANAFQLDFNHNQLSRLINSKPIHLILQIIERMDTLSLDNFKLYVKNVFLSHY